MKTNWRVNLYLLVIECDFLMAEGGVGEAGQLFLVETCLAGRVPDTPARVSTAALNKRRQLADIGKLAPHVKKKKKNDFIRNSFVWV